MSNIFQVDIVVAAMTMTSEREEVIDFVAPYFDQSGISILLRRKEPKQSIFKFMQVRKPTKSVAQELFWNFTYIRST